MLGCLHWLENLLGMFSPLLDFILGPRHSLGQSRHEFRAKVVHLHDAMGLYYAYLRLYYTTSKHLVLFSASMRHRRRYVITKIILYINVNSCCNLLTYEDMRRGVIHTKAIYCRLKSKSS